MNEAPKKTMRMRIEANVEPATHHIAVHATVTNPPTNTFHLGRFLDLDEVRADDRVVAHHEVSGEAMFEGADRKIAIDAAVPGRLSVSYHGSLRNGDLPDILDQVSAIGPDGVELAIYAVWFPLFAGMPTFTFELTSNLPSGFVAAANGTLQARTTADGRSMLCWASTSPGFDLALVAAPSLRSQADPDRRVTVYASRLPASYTTRMQQDLSWALDRLAEISGPLASPPTVTLVYAPRDGWGYVRRPLIVVAEDKAITQMSEPFGPAEDFRYAAHEVAHFWWTIADPATPHDWINEGLAEYSAYRLAAELHGEAYARQRAAEYRQRAAQGQTATPIAETAQDSPDREVNRYDKATLLLLQARRRFGEAALDGFLRALHACFGGTTAATTESFLRLAAETLGPAASTFLDQALRSPTWPPPSLSGPHS